MTETTDRPLVTFALFAYNQEQYIREAVEGAFAQTYEPLEIILSDDCSTDRTFEIMQEMAAAYEGSHEIITRRNRRNLGLIGHVNEITSKITNPILLLAAGDDISHPHRTSAVVSTFKAHPRTLLVHSGVQNIDATGKVLDISPPVPDQSLNQIVKSASVYIGATGAIRRELVSHFGPIMYPNTYEDLIFGTRAALLGDIASIPSALISYRNNVGIIAHARSAPDRTNKRRNSIHHRIATLKQRELDVDRSNHPRSKELQSIIEAELSRAKARLRYHDNRKDFFHKIFSKECVHHIRALSSETKYLLKLID